MIRVRQIKVDVRKDCYDELVNSLVRKLKIDSSDIVDLNIVKKSIDARHKDCVCFIYEVDVNLKNEKFIRLGPDVLESSILKYSFSPSGNASLSNRPIIVGSGPCGLFCAYELALYGYNPIVLERGEDMDSRVKTVLDFWENGKFNSNSNVQFGEGGAGTFSDGKLSTQIKDKNNRIKEVLDVFISNGAPSLIGYDFMPHIGTDKLRDVVKNMRNKIISLGGEFRYNSCLTDIRISDGRVCSIVVNDSDVIPCDVLVLAIGHSARDTFRMLHSKGIEMCNKPFAVGLRVMHSQDMISYNQYGDFYKYLKPASYKLTYNSNGRGIYSFCMCPGGYVVNASSEDGRLVVNGMSNYDRESGIANSAIVVTVNESDYGNCLFDGVRFQEKLEECAYRIGNGYIPVQKYGDFVNNVKSDNFGKVLPMIKGKYTFSNLNLLFDSSINSSICDAFNYFNTKIKGFNDSDALLAGVESRTSSPIKIIRDDNYQSNIVGIYPAGEGAGYAGGIVSAAVDGIKVFESIASKYKF
jgi:hypothetical protein